MKIAELLREVEQSFDVFEKSALEPIHNARKVVRVAKALYAAVAKEQKSIAGPITITVTKVNP